MVVLKSNAHCPGSVRRVPSPIFLDVVLLVGLEDVVFDLGHAFSYSGYMPSFSACCARFPEE
jgi:hypothetical protein